MRRWQGQWGGGRKELKDGTQGYGEFSREVRTGTDLERQIEDERWFIPRWRDKWEQRLWGKHGKGMSWGERDRHVRSVRYERWAVATSELISVPYLHSQTSWHFTGQRKGRALTCSEYLSVSGKDLHFVLFIHNYPRKQELGPISQMRKLMPRNIKNPMQGSTVTKW